MAAGAVVHGVVFDKAVCVLVRADGIAWGHAVLLLLLAHADLVPAGMVPLVVLVLVLAVVVLRGERVVAALHLMLMRRHWRHGRHGRLAVVAAAAAAARRRRGGCLLGHHRVGEEGAGLQVVAARHPGPGVAPAAGRQLGRRAAVHRPDGLLEGPDVVVGEPQRLDLGQLGLVGKGGQDCPQLFQGLVQRLHPRPLPVVGLGPPQPLEVDHVRRRLLDQPVLGPPPDGPSAGLQPARLQPAGPLLLLLVMPRPEPVGSLLLHLGRVQGQGVVDAVVVERVDPVGQDLGLPRLGHLVLVGWGKKWAYV